MKKQEEYVEEEIKSAMVVLIDEGFSIKQAKALITAIGHIYEAKVLAAMDYRFIEGDDEREIRGY